MKAAMLRRMNQVNMIVRSNSERRTGEGLIHLQPDMKNIWLGQTPVQQYFR
jgi:hypothetical protein